MSEPYVIVAAGLGFEAQLALADRGTRVCCGRGSEMAVALATAIDAGCTGVLSFGVAGALDPQLRTGVPIVASSVIGANGVRIALPTDERWSQMLLRLSGSFVHAPVLGVDLPVTEPEDKLRLFHQTGAAIVDMESHIAASVASDHGLPFAVLRVVVDPAYQRVPPAALRGMRPDGSLDPFAVLRALWRSPGDIASMPSIARNAWIARNALARARRGLGRGFGLRDLG
jgi:adenosylhomocysteine nucleosidase